ncbi:hypothetical protein DD238_002850 [Peronospora effusa]|uniref:Uncharacterized protein n=1 Tax=Peronospora effusa TaxID=542832 RepID=A0A3M6VJR1_9STRA|nr:hypothetical protein DD238_002850 [Peronospora effusa]
MNFRLTNLNLQVLVLVLLVLVLLVLLVLVLLVLVPVLVLVLLVLVLLVLLVLVLVLELVLELVLILVLVLVLILVLVLVLKLLDDDRFGHCGLSAGKSDIAGVAQELLKQRQHAQTVIKVAVLDSLAGHVSELAQDCEYRPLGQPKHGQAAHAFDDLMHCCIRLRSSSMPSQFQLV